ncbi:ATP-binding protein [Pelagicoccus mobilis]|uniref:histidine kinase n=1 Tax=Pelagicoccus mobilis TaxID=415221 RepID=A0A934RQZ7_9BACT|nr:ATP-binding protein [Pelagicoccus mobilis]MBK1875297.1 response regulator [Pelagicoccus mobilis]
MKRLLTGLLFLSAPLCGILFAKPVRPLPHADPWRWQELEPISKFSMRHGNEDEQEILYFCADKQLVIYDGYQTKIHELPERYRHLNLFRVYPGLEGIVYLFSNGGLLSFRNETWAQLSESDEPIEHRNPNLYSRGRGNNEFFLVGGRVHILYKGELTPIEGIDEKASEIMIDSYGRLWTANRKSTFCHTLSNSEPWRATDSKEAKIPFDSSDFFIFAPNLNSNADGSEIWLSIGRRGYPSYRYDSEKLKWIPQDVGQTELNLGHQDAFFDKKTDDFVIVSRSDLHIRRNGTWFHLDELEDLADSRFRFFLSRKNGNLVVGGHGIKTVEGNLSNDRQETFEGVLFQCEDTRGHWWFIDIDSKIFECDPINDIWTQHSSNQIDTPISITAANDGTVWVAGSHEGTAAISYLDKNRWTRVQHPELRSRIGHLSVHQAANGDLYFGSGHEFRGHPNNLGGFAIYRRISGEYRSTHIPYPMVPNRPVGFAESPDGTSWVGGLQLRETKRLFEERMMDIPEFKNEFWIDHLLYDSNNLLWVAIWNKGLFRFDGIDWEKIQSENKLSSEQYCYLLEDKVRDDNIWIMGKSGVSRFDGQNWYPTALPEALKFARESGTLAQSSDGSLWVNQAARVWYFRLNTDFRPSENLRANFKAIRYNLDTDAPIVTIDPTSRTPAAPADIYMNWQGHDKWSRTPSKELKYSYRINGSPWSSYEAKSEVVLLDVEAGNHKFEVRAMDREGNVSDTIAVSSFYVQYPIWLRAWFITLVVLAVVSIVALIAIVIRQRMKHLLEVEDLKLQLFTNLSHELRTPLTVVLGPLESQIEKLPANWDKKPLELVHRNAKRVLRLIDQLLDFRRAEVQSIQFSRSLFDVVETVRENIQLLQPAADQKQQNISFKNELEHTKVWYDPEALEKILNNLLGNAIKYTPESGYIEVFLSHETSPSGENIVLSVSDNGLGIPSDSIDKIFDPFFRVSDRSKEKLRGSGIGLAYTKNLVDASEGTIDVESPVKQSDGSNSGSRFTVRLPLTHPPTASEAPDKGQAPATIDADKPILLLVEDDRDILDYLNSELRPIYNLLNATNGQEALELAVAEVPDLILTDVRMPKMDGKELCRQIKSTEETNHIPVIMLTSLKSDHHELEGLRSGADDFLNKPISSSLLREKIKNHLASRRLLHDKFKTQTQEMRFEPKEFTKNQTDQDFVAKARNFIFSHLDDPQLDVEGLASHMNMSRTHLYRKFKAILGMSPSVFIRSIRMNEAARILQTSDHNVTEVAAMVGMEDSSSFSYTFKKHHNKSPSEFMHRSKG